MKIKLKIKHPYSAVHGSLIVWHKVNSIIDTETYLTFNISYLGKETIKRIEKKAIDRMWFLK